VWRGTDRQVTSGVPGRRGRAASTVPQAAEQAATTMRPTTYILTSTIVIVET
jgi:hypothetical protein